MSSNPILIEEIKSFLQKKTETDEKTAQILSVYKLDDQEKAAIIKAFPEIKSYKLENIVDPSLIGGFIIRYQSYVIDLSLARRLNNFRKLFYEVT